MVLIETNLWGRRKMHFSHAVNWLIIAWLDIDISGYSFKRIALCFDICTSVSLGHSTKKGLIALCVPWNKFFLGLFFPDFPLF